MTRQKAYETPEQMQAIIEEYFADCQNRQAPYTISGLACALGIDRDSLLNYEKKEGYEPFFGTIKKAKALILARQEESLTGGKTNPAGLIFSMKNNYGWADKFEIEQTNDITVKFEGFDDL